MPESRLKPSVGIYGEFLREAGERARILPDEVIRDRITALRNPATKPEDQAAIRTEIFDSVLKTIPFVIARSGRSNPEELVGEMFETIDSCIDNFNPTYISPKSEEQTKFSSYIISSMEDKLRSPRTVAEVGQPVALPVRSVDYGQLMRKAWEEFVQRRHKEPDPDEWYKATVAYIAHARKDISMLTGMTEETFSAIRQHGVEKKYVSIGKPVGRGTVNIDSLDLNFGDIAEIIPDETENTLKKAAQNMLKEEMQEYLHLLPPRERTTLELRFGIGLNEKGEERHELTLDETAKIFGVTREAIRQRQDKAFKKLLHLRISDLRDYLSTDAPERQFRGHKKFKSYTEDGKTDPDKEKKSEDYASAIKGLASRLMWKLPADVEKALARAIYTAPATNGIIDPIVFGYVVPEGVAKNLYNAQIRYNVSAQAMVEDIVDAINSVLTDPFRKSKISDGSLFYENAKWESVGTFTFSPEDIPELLKPSS